MRWTGGIDVDDYLGELLARVLDILGDKLLGLYLHGSAAMGAFVPTRSDIDVLGLSVDPISTASKTVLAEAVSESSLPSPGVGLEISIVTAQSARTPSDAPPFELHVNTQGGKVVDGATAAGDPDLVAHYAMARARGIRLHGPEPAEAIAPVDPSLLLRSLAYDLAWALDGEHVGSYAVLNACRALRFARTGEHCSKPEGGAWAIEAGEGDPELIATALRRQAGADEQVDPGVATAFVEAVRIELLRHAAD